MTYTALRITLLASLAALAACDDDGSQAGPDQPQDAAGGKADQIDPEGKAPAQPEEEGFARETEEILAAIDAGGAATQFNYCAQDGTDAEGNPNVASLKCRSLFLYDNDAEMFRISFINGAGLGGASEYAMRNDDGTYRLYVDTTLDGTPEVSGVSEENQMQDVEFEDGFPTITNMTLHLSPTSFALVDLSFSAEQASLDGVIVDESAGTQNELHLTYARI